MIPSEKETQALMSLESTAVIKNGKYEVGLIRKDPDIKLPNSYENALTLTLKCFQGQFSRQPNLRELIQKEVDNKGYAPILTTQELAISNKRVWYLPTFIIRNPNNPGRVRLVWDVATKSGGKALNDFIHSRPDLLNSLMDLLISFRVGHVAICGDIAEMFHQIRVRPEDIHAQRFLWIDENSILQQPNVYVMEALTFGINCAPCIAHFIRDKIADRFQHQYPVAAQVVKDSQYVDFIYSDDGDTKVANIATDVKNIHATGGFHIRNWSSNSQEVLQKLGAETTAPKAVEITATEKVLGLYWMPDSDDFTFICKFASLKRNVFECDYTPTKRKLLQVLTSMYDPLGFVSCFTIELKILLQDVWRSGIGWDDDLPEELSPKWTRWKRLLPAISDVLIPRCYFRPGVHTQDVQVHTFVDASELAYAAVCYLRIQGETTYLSFLASKAKVAPLNPMSIPRMELQVAVVGIKLSNRILSNKRLSINSRWSDSKTVLKWLRMEPRKFQQFVMHRMGEILESSDVSQWNWVPTHLNPADFATKASHTNNIKWKFNPPVAPHMGGAWERLIRSVKSVLYAICPTRKFTNESLQSALWEVEYILNSRPLTFVSLDSKDDEAITPNHLLLGSASGYKPIFETTLAVRHTWQAVQQFADQFWRRWVREYVTDLARRGKWLTKTPLVAVGDVVLVVEENLPCNTWPKGVIDQVILAKDNQVRRVVIRTANGMLHRPVAKVAVLDVGNVGAKPDPETDKFTGGRILPPNSKNRPEEPSQTIEG